MSDKALTIFARFESLATAGQIPGFKVVIQADGLHISSDDAKEEQEIKLDKETLASLQTYFEGTDTIAQTSPDYTCLKSIVKAKAILERMLHPGQSTDNNS